MKAPELDRLIELARRRELSAAEQARLEQLLSAAPAAWPGRAEDQALTRLLARLPEAPRSSNFTARVLQAIDRAEAAADRAGARSPLTAGLRRWFGRLAWTAAAFMVCGGSWLQYQRWQRSETARSLQVITDVASVPSVEVLKDFEAIQSFASVPPAMDIPGDLELLNALQ